MTDIHSCLNFITGEDPDTDTSLSQVVNGLTYFFLKLVLNGSRANQIEFHFDFFLQLFHFDVFLEGS